MESQIQECRCRKPALLQLIVTSGTSREYLWSCYEKRGKEKAPQFKEAVDKHLLFLEGRALLRVLSCPPLLTREKAILKGSKKDAFKRFKKQKTTHWWASGYAIKRN
jgi:hypothetical protein